MMTVQAKETEKKDSNHHGDTIFFSGYYWITKESYGKHTGPGNNYFSSSRDNVYVDEQGKLHLRLTNRNDKWYCPEVRLISCLGYGKYYFYLDPIVMELDKDIVVGLFLYDRDDTSNFHKEIDIEFSTWGKDSSLNSQYVLQPKESEAHRFQTDLSKCTKHVIEICKKNIKFKSYYESFELGKDSALITKHKEVPDYDYVSTNEKISMNVWLYQKVEPFNLKEFEVVISSFKYEPFWIDKFMMHKK